jgi:septal ring factor EnvC (AmiA/AmiB activator)
MDTPIPGDAQMDPSGSTAFPSNTGSSKIPAVRTLEGDAARLGARPHTTEGAAPVHVPVAPSASAPIPASDVPRDTSGAIVIPEFPAENEEASLGMTEVPPPTPHHDHAAVPHKPSVAPGSSVASAEAGHAPQTLSELLDANNLPVSDVTAAPVPASGEEGVGVKLAEGSAGPQVTYTPPAANSSGTSPLFATGNASLMAEIAEVEPNIVAPAPSVPAPVGVPPAAVPFVSEKSFEDQIADLERDMKALEEKRKTIEEHTSKLFATRRTIEETLAPIQKEVKEIAAEISRIEEAEKKTEAGSEARRAEEKKRWEAIEKSRSIDEGKWKVKENLESVLNDIKTEETAYQTASDEEASIHGRIQKLHVEAKRRDLNADLDKILTERGTIQTKLDELSQERARIEALLHEAEIKESEIEGEVVDTTKKLSSAKTLGEERMLADARYRLEKERHDVEEERWKAEDELKHVGGDITEATKKLDEIKKKEEDVKKRLDALAK